MTILLSLQLVIKFVKNLTQGLFKVVTFTTDLKGNLYSRWKLSGVRPGPVVRQSVREKTGGNFSGINGQSHHSWGFGCVEGRS